VAKEWKTRHRNDLLRDSSYDGDYDEVEFQILTAAHIREFGSGAPGNRFGAGVACRAASGGLQSSDCRGRNGGNGG